MVSDKNAQGVQKCSLHSKSIQMGVGQLCSFENMYQFHKAPNFTEAVIIHGFSNNV